MTLIRQVLDRVLLVRQHPCIGFAGVVHDRIGVETQPAPGATRRLHQLPKLSR